MGLITRARKAAGRELHYKLAELLLSRAKGQKLLYLGPSLAHTRPPSRYRTLVVPN